MNGLLLLLMGLVVVIASILHFELNWLIIHWLLCRTYVLFITIRLQLWSMAYCFCYWHMQTCRRNFIFCWHYNIYLFAITFRGWWACWGAWWLRQIGIIGWQESLKSSPKAKVNNTKSHRTCHLLCVDTSLWRCCIRDAFGSCLLEIDYILNEVIKIKIDAQILKWFIPICRYQILFNIS